MVSYQELTGIHVRNGEVAAFQGEFCAVNIYIAIAIRAKRNDRYIEVTVLQRAGLAKVYCIPTEIFRYRFWNATDRVYKVTHAYLKLKLLVNVYAKSNFYLAEEFKASCKLC